MKKTLLLLTLALVTQLTFAQNLPSYVPADGLVGYWGFNGNADDQSGNGNNGTVNGATLTTDRFGNVDKAYSFNGGSNYIQVANSNSLQNVNSITISAWINITQLYQSGGAGFFPIVSKSNLQGTYGNYAFGFWSPNIIADLNNAETATAFPFSLGNWQNVVVTIGSGTTSFYLNGNLLWSGNSGVFPNNPVNNLPLIFGMDRPGLVEYANGKIDDIGIWNRVLSSQEISNIYNQVTPYSDTCNNVSGSLTQGLVGYWPFCGNANDDSGHGYNGIVEGATLTTDRFGNANSAYNFSGTANNITLSNSQNIVNSSFSVSAWCTIENLTPSYYDATLIGQFNGQIANDSKWLFGYRSINTQRGVSYYLFDNSGYSPSTNFATLNWNPTQSSWYHIVWVFNAGNSIKTYVNGILNSDVAISLTNINNSSSNYLTKIGNGVDIDVLQNLPWNGKIDDLAIWNRSLSTTEVSQLYNQNQCFTNTTVTDTLIINVGQLSYTNPIYYANNITLYPNPANTQVNISFTNINDLTGGQIKIINSLGQQVATTPITLSGTNTTMPLTTWGGTGLYFVQILNSQGQIVDIKKIILQ